MLKSKWTGDLCFATPTVSDLILALGGIDPDRILMVPAPGTATVADVGRYECELLENTLVRKAVHFPKAVLGACLVGRVLDFVLERNLGIVVGPHAFFEVSPETVRAADVAFLDWSSMPGRVIPPEPVPKVAPDLCADILTPQNTETEMKRKRKDYFTAGVKLVWQIDPAKPTATVYDADDAGTILSPTDSLDGGKVLPGFTLPLAELFGELDREAPDATPAGGGS